MTAFPATATDQPLQIVVSALVPGNHAPDAVLAAETYTLGNLVERGLATPQTGDPDWISLPNYPAQVDAQKALVALLRDMASSLAAKTGEAQVLQVRRAVEAFNWQQPGFEDHTWTSLRGELIAALVEQGRYPTGPPTAEVALVEAGDLVARGLAGTIFGDAVVATLTIRVL